MRPFFRETSRDLSMRALLGTHISGTHTAHGGCRLACLEDQSRHDSECVAARFSFPRSMSPPTLLPFSPSFAPILGLTLCFRPGRPQQFLLSDCPPRRCPTLLSPTSRHPGLFPVCVCAWAPLSLLCPGNPANLWEDGWGKVRSAKSSAFPPLTPSFRGLPVPRSSHFF